MIRKAIIVVLTLATVGVAIAWLASYWSPVRSRYWPHEMVGHAVRMAFAYGIVSCSYSRRKYKPLTPEDLDFYSSGGHTQWDMPKSVRREYVAHAGYRTISHVYDNLEMDPPSYVYIRMISVYCPSGLLLIILVTYPTLDFLRGPLRRYRRRRKGLCLKCAYDLTGNISGVCPECDTEINK